MMMIVVMMMRGRLRGHWPSLILFDVPISDSVDILSCKVMIPRGSLAKGIPEGR